MSRVVVKVYGVVVVWCVLLVGCIVLNAGKLPSSTQIAFIAHRDEYHHIKMLDVERGLLVDVFQASERIDAITWTPDGERLFMALFREGRQVRDIAELNLKTGIFRWVTAGPFDNNAPDVSPDGHMLVYQTYGIQGTGWNIVTLDLISSEIVSLYEGAGNEGRPRWSPDGTQIVFEAQVALSSSLMVVERVSGDLQVISRELDYAPTWSPDGTQIGFVSSRDNNFDIYVMGADGSALHRLTWHGSADFYPTWSPNGTQLLFTSRRDADQYDQLYILNFNTTAIDLPTRLTNGNYNHISPVWRP